MLVAVTLTFIAVFLLVVAAVLGLTTVKDSTAFILKRRLRGLALRSGHEELPDELRSEILKETPPFELMLARIPGLGHLEQTLDQAGLKISVSMFLLLALAATLVAFVAMFVISRSYLYATVAGLLIPFIAYEILHLKKQQRLNKFTTQMPDVLATIARSLRAGHSMTSAIELVGNEMPNPAGELFKVAYEQQKLGLSIVETLSNLPHRIESLDLRFFITSIAVNREVGGNLAEILDKLAETIRERIKIRRQVQVYTAQGRLSGYILAVLPFVAYFMMNILMPHYEKLLFTEKAGNFMLIAALAAQITGFLIIRRIINIRI